MPPAPFLTPPACLARLARHGALAAMLLAPVAWAAPPFEAPVNGIVKDQSTDLMWDGCPLGKSGASCETGIALTATWQGALQAVQTANANNHKGHNDWRLPNVKELQSLVDKSASMPSIDATAFPGTPAYYFWSSTTNVIDPARAWIVSFSEGFTSPTGKTDGFFHVRLVRSGQPSASFDALADTTAPTITVHTATLGNNGTTASAGVTVDEAATGFWQVLPASSPAPTAAALAALPAGQQLALTANTPAVINLTGLSPGTAYVLYVTAQDAAGNLQTTVASASFTTPNVPGAPSVTATPGAAGSGTVTLALSAPADNGSAITGYTVSPNPNNVVCTPPSCAITGLANATQYIFTVTAANGVGPSSAGSSAAVWLQGTQTITFDALPDQNLGATVPALSASASSNLTVAFASTTPDVCTVAGTTVTLVAQGTCTIEATQAGDDAWLAADAVRQGFAVGARATVAPVPVLSPWLLGVLAALLTALGLRRRRAGAV